MTTAYETALSGIEQKPARWVITGAAGFIGSHLVEKLLRHGQTVVGVDNFVTGNRKNLDEVQALVGAEAWSRFTLADSDVRREEDCLRFLEGADHILHQAGIGSVPLSIEKPREVHDANVTGFLNILTAAQKLGIKRVVYASSSSVYGDDPLLPKQEHSIGIPLSPYAASKYIDEIYAATYHQCHGLQSVGLRYFNMFGPRQDPHRAYAAVITLWIALLRKGDPIYINGDGETTRDFCYVANVVQANLLGALTASNLGADVFNVGLGGRTTLNQLFNALRDSLASRDPNLAHVQAVHRDFRAGDIRHSMADIAKAETALGYFPTHSVAAGLQDALDWYWQNL
ncbi:MAG TPA: NAD-dependent epimerase/dehydratase family protein [Verrucomicrobium sp.]|nr:NAD-dependent epimerase/dehydratase family protein [Verrucomicrobium sp.]